jgi:hypothetical protein
VIRRVVNEVLVALDGEFSKIYADSGRPSIPPERLLRALLPARLAKILIKNDAPPDSIFHATRHTIATWLKKEKHSMWDIGVVLNHSEGPEVGAVGRVGWTYRIADQVRDK